MRLTCLAFMLPGHAGPGPGPTAHAATEATAGAELARDTGHPTAETLAGGGLPKELALLQPVPPATIPRRSGF